MSGIPISYGDVFLHSSNTFTADNTFDNTAPKSNVVPSDNDDLTNKLYVDNTAGSNNGVHTQSLNFTNGTLSLAQGTSGTVVSPQNISLDGRYGLITDVAANTSNIATNTSNIATNTSNIATNTSNITTNTNDITTNTSNIATNTSNIATNTNDIATNTSNIATNTSNITTNTNDITTNTNIITTNTNDIAAINTNLVNVMTTNTTQTITGVKTFNGELFYSQGTTATNGSNIVNKNYVDSAITNKVSGYADIEMYFTAFTSATGTFYSNTDFELRWNSTYRQPTFKRIYGGGSDWWDIYHQAPATTNGSYSSSMWNAKDDININYNGEYYFAPSGAVNINFNLNNYGQRNICFLTRESISTKRVYKIEYWCGHSSSIYIHLSVYQP